MQAVETKLHKKRRSRRKVNCNKCPVQKFCTVPKTKPRIPRIKDSTKPTELGVLLLALPYVYARKATYCPLVQLIAHLGYIEK